MPHATSTFCDGAGQLPRDYERFWAFSVVMVRLTSCVSSSTTLNLTQYWMPSPGGVLRHSGYAAAPAATARSTAAADDCGTATQGLAG